MNLGILSDMTVLASGYVPKGTIVLVDGVALNSALTRLSLDSALQELLAQRHIAVMVHLDDCSDYS
jgi:hypothetical protein